MFRQLLPQSPSVREFITPDAPTWRPKGRCLDGRVDGGVISGLVNVQQKIWKSTIFNGITMGNSYVYWENCGKLPFLVGKLWKIIMFHEFVCTISTGHLLWKRAHLWMVPVFPIL